MPAQDVIDGMNFEFWSFGELWGPFYCEVGDCRRACYTICFAEEDLPEDRDTVSGDDRSRMIARMVVDRRGAACCRDHEDEAARMIKEQKQLTKETDK